MTGTEYARVDPGPLVKIFILKHETGELISPVRRSTFRGPLLRADSFAPDPTVPCAPGIHAWRFGHLATPSCWWVAIAHCRIPPGCRAVMSPWAVRAEALLVERLIFHQSVGESESVSARVRRLWGPHCDIEFVRASQYVAEAAPLGFRLQPSRAVVRARAGVLEMAFPRGRRVCADPDGMVYEHLGGHWTRHRGGRLIRHVRRAMRRWFDRGDDAVKDIVTPWIRYLQYIG